MPRTASPPASDPHDETEAPERQLARLPTKTVLTALGGVAVATGWASSADAMPAYDHAPPPATPAPDPGTANSAEAPGRAKAVARPVAAPPAAKPIKTQPVDDKTQPVDDPGTSTNAEAPTPVRRTVKPDPPAVKPKPVPDPGTSTNAEAPRRSRDVGTANSAEGPPPGVSTRQLQDDPGTANSAEGPGSDAARRTATPPPAANPRPVADPGTSTNAEAPTAARPTAKPKPIPDPGTATNAEAPQPVRDVGTANSAEGPGSDAAQKTAPPTVGRQAAKAPASDQPGVPPPLTPAQRQAAQNYVNTLDHIKADGDALRPGTAQQLRRFGADPRAVQEAHRIIAERDARQKRLDQGGVEADPDPSQYQLKERGFDATSQQNVRAVQQTHPRVGLPAVTNDHNRKTTPLPEGPVKDVPGAQGYGWNDGDDDVDYWTPQGIGGQNGEQVTSWYRTGEDDKATDVRVGFTSPDQKGYRFALAVKPKADGTYDHVAVHAGGSAQFGNYMYIPDTTHGLRVYDTREISRVPHDKLGASGNYKYLLPEVGSYENTGTDLRYSTVSVDRSNPAKPALVVGEYRDDGYDGNGKSPNLPVDTHIVRWENDPKTGRLAQSKASAAYVTHRNQVQGAAMDHGNVYLSSSQGDTGRLYHGKPGGTIHDSPWSSSPESLYVNGGRLWSLSEKRGERSVFSVPLPRD